MTEQKQALQKFEREVKIHINTVLYEQGYITEQMFHYAQAAFQSVKQTSMV